MANRAGHTIAGLLRKVKRLENERDALRAAAQAYVDVIEGGDLCPDDYGDEGDCGQADCRLCALRRVLARISVT